MKFESERFVLGDVAEQEDVGGGVVRQILGHNDDLMLVRVRFAHDHPHSQVAYVESGVFEFTVGNETTILKAGDCAYVPPGMEHGAICKEKGVLLDIFSPTREDFLEG